ncbi:MBL fold metallo-hydrolase [Macrococcus lamae]|uniref:MBL fold metallo-hydrolase n=1 Tax=Macrococcus lamae TaxID=198484 RepID=A0A4R6BWD0_9STAP|nr:MBL fold metallo-hydrolase [Macrococcus lamae]TDM12727.1 MBL fold metallo-hydrolase [Macrococcus lamae]
MYFKSFFNQPLAQMSYLVGCQKTGEAILIDPLRDLTPYIEAAEKENLSINYVTETHIHADFASGLREAAVILNAQAFVSGHGGDDWKYKQLPDQAVTLTDGYVIKIGNVKLEVIHTPGHTPESISFLLTDHHSKAPMGLFTGDFMFVGDVGRPDLLETAAGMKNTTALGAKQMFASIGKIKNLPDYLQIWPGHGAGSACGKSLGAVPMSTLGYEKENNWAFQYNDEDQFIDALISEQPEPPYYFKEMKHINRDGVNLYNNDIIAPISKLNSLALTIDLRQKELFSENMSNGINIPYNKKFIGFVGWYLDYDMELQFIGDYEEVQKAAAELKLIGFDRVSGYMPTNKIRGKRYEQIEPEVFKSLDKKINILDVRTDQEWNDSHFDEAAHLHYGKLLNETVPYEKDQTIYVHCQSGVRSAIAISVLKKQGYDHVINIKDGYSAIR